MPVLSRPRWELMAQHLAGGKTQEEAYALTGYKPHRGNACILANRPEVKARIAELQAEAARDLRITVAGIIERLELARLAAMAEAQYAVAVSATMGQAKVLGLIVEKRQHTFKKIEDMTEDELRAALAGGSDDDN